MPKWAVWLIVGVAIALIIGPRLIPTTDPTRVTYTEFLELVEDGDLGGRHRAPLLVGGRQIRFGRGRCGHIGFLAHLWMYLPRSPVFGER